MSENCVGFLRAIALSAILLSCHCDWIGSAAFSCTLDCLNDPFEEDDDNDNNDSGTVDVLDDTQYSNDDSDSEDDSAMFDDDSDTEDDSTSEENDFVENTF